MSNIELTPIAKAFVANVSNHEMKVDVNDGINRHISFAVNGSVNFSFAITTFENNLVFSGDMGTFVFCRMNDMFNFFRSFDKENIFSNVTQNYWASKVTAGKTEHFHFDCDEVAASLCEGIACKIESDYDLEAPEDLIFTASLFNGFDLKEDLPDIHKVMIENNLTLDDLIIELNSIKSNVADFVDWLDASNESDAIHQISNKDFKSKNGAFTFSFNEDEYDFYDSPMDGMGYKKTAQFKWACHAIVWAISQFDALEG